MAKYIYSTDSINGYNSGYESDGGTFYDENGTLGSGSVARARKFSSKDGVKGKAILDPLNVDEIEYDEVLSKYTFFQTMYPEQDVTLIQKGETYRLVLPLIPGETYGDLFNLRTEEQIKLFISAIKALEDCHKKGYVVVDIKEDNIHYDASTDKSYLIDGGLAVKTGDVLHYQFFQAKKPAKKGLHFAPECFSLQGARAAETMDIYSLGNTLEHILKHPPYEISSLLQQCQLEDPKQRPSLKDLETQLAAMLLEIEHPLLHAEIEKIPVTQKVDKTTPMLEKEFDQEEHLTNSALAFSTVSIKKATLRDYGAFFQPTASKSLECVENTVQELEDLALVFRDPNDLFM